MERVTVEVPGQSATGHHVNRVAAPGARPRWLTVLTLTLVTAALLTPRGAQAQAPLPTSCPPGVPGYNGAHPATDPGGLVCVPGGEDAFAKRVVSFTPGQYGPAGVCSEALGWPPNFVEKNQNRTASGALGGAQVTNPLQPGPERVNLDTSMGVGGQLVLEFSNALTGSGDSSPDIWMWEVDALIEPHDVEVATSPNGPWTLVGRATSLFNGSEGFDIDDDGFNRDSRLSYIRITDTQSPGPATLINCTAGSDIDAVAILSNPIPREPNVRVPTLTTMATAALMVALAAIAVAGLRNRQLGTM